MADKPFEARSANFETLYHSLLWDIWRAGGGTGRLVGKGGGGLLQGGANWPWLALPAHMLYDELLLGDFRGSLTGTICLLGLAD